MRNFYLNKGIIFAKFQCSKNVNDKKCLTIPEEGDQI